MNFKISFSGLLSLLFLPLLLLTAGCHSHHEYADDPFGNYDSLWKIIDEHYCFFGDNGLDWKQIGEKYREKIHPEMTDMELFNVCSGLLSELQDGHVNLSTPFAVYYYRKWWTDYPQNFSLRTLQEYYLDFDWQTVSGLMYKKFEDRNLGYIRCSSFVSPIGNLNLDYILAILYECDALIIDVRDNGGGELTNVQTLLERFISSKTCFGYISHKTGPGHDEFSDPYPVEFTPASGRVMWNKPVAVLINRSCFSAANFFASSMKILPDVTLIGTKTGGGGGLPFSAQLPNGWRVRFSAVPVTDASGRSIEKGVSPSDGFEVIATQEELASGKDAVLERAFELLQVSSSED